MSMSDFYRWIVVFAANLEKEASRMDKRAEDCVPGGDVAKQLRNDATIYRDIARIVRETKNECFKGDFVP